METKKNSNIETRTKNYRMVKHTKTVQLKTKGKKTREKNKSRTKPKRAIK